MEKSLAFAKGSCLERGSCSMPDKASSVGNGFSLKIHNEKGPMNVRQCMDAVSSPGSHMISEVKAPKFGGPCSALGMPVGSSSMEVNLSNSKNMNSKVNCKSSPTSAIQAPNAFLSLQTISSDSDIISMKNLLYCSISQEADEDMQLQSGSIYEETRNSKPTGGSVTTSNHMDSPCKKLQSCHSLIANGSFEIQELKRESFAALHILADVAAWVLEGEEKAMASMGQWQIFHPSGAPSSHKFVIKRAKSDSQSLSPELRAHAHKLLPSLSEHLLPSKLGSPRYSVKCPDNQVKEHGLADKDKVENPNVRSSKRNRSLNSKYSDFVLQPLKRGTKR